jgi:glycosyltransferase involved in cell wall biosynthesis
MKKRIFVRGPVLSQSGYGEQSRFALRALRSREDIFEIYIQPINWGQTGWIWKEDEFRTWMDGRIMETQLLLQKQQLAPDISLQITIPNEFEKLCPINIGYTAGIETTKVAPQWLQKGNDMDKILVVSQHAKDSYVNTIAQATNQKTGETFPYKLETPVEVVWENTPTSQEIEEIPGFTPRHDFNFLSVSQMGPRKNLENTIKWFVEEFIDQDVGLILKTNTRANSKIDHEFTEKSLKTILGPYPDRKCSVSLLHGDLSEGQMRALYEHNKVKAMVNISHGEGFGLPLFESARSSLPIITVGWSGQLDFLVHNKKKYFLEVKHELKPVQKEAVWNGVIQEESEWAFADQGSYKMALRMMYKKYDGFKKQALELQPLVNTKFSDEALFEGFCNAFHSKEDELDLDEWLNNMESELVESE